MPLNSVIGANQPDWTEKSGLLFNIINIEAYEPANPSVLLIILKDRPELTSRDAKNIELVPAMLAWPTPQVRRTALQ